MKIYLAGPDVFLSDAAAIGRRKQDICLALAAAIDKALKSP
jgi:nucleoside 2-deoxyribosyltransferase